MMMPVTTIGTAMKGPTAQVDAHRVPGHQGLQRVRLFDQLDAASGSGPVLVLAPAGFGKSTLLAQYARRHIGTAAAYQADAMEVEHGDTAARLVEAVLSASRPMPEAAPADLLPPIDSRSHTDPSRSLVDARRIVEAARDETIAVLEVMAAAAAEPGGLLLTLDHLDHLIGTPGETLLAQVLARRPRNVQVLMAARRPLAANLMRAELARDGAVVGVDDLRFRRWEVERLLDEVYGEPLPPEEAALLARRTGGWPAGLALFNRGTRGRPMVDRCRAAGAQLERWPAFRQVFAEDVLRTVPADVLELLVRTCVFDTLTTDRCGRLLGEPVDAGMLEALVGTYSLPITAHGDSYRFEPVFRAYLGLLLADRCKPVELREWHRRAAEVLVDEEEYAEAGRSLARAGDWLALQLLLAEHGRAVVRQPAAELIELVPAPYRDEEPWLIFAEAESLLNDAQLPAAGERFKAAAAMFESRGAAGDEIGLRATHRELEEIDSLTLEAARGSGHPQGDRAGAGRGRADPAGRRDLRRRRAGGDHPRDAHRRRGQPRLGDRAGRAAAGPGVHRRRPRQGPTGGAGEDRRRGRVDRVRVRRAARPGRAGAGPVALHRGRCVRGRGRLPPGR
jgi:ATP/maltotriose-dependent transcriptional regulator MalT